MKMYSRPGVALDAVFVVIVTGLEDGLVETTATSDDTNHSAARGFNLNRQNLKNKMDFKNMFEKLQRKI